MIKKLAFLFVCAIIVSCSPNKQWSESPFVPEGYTLENLQGIDSYVGKIHNDKIEFHFDYGMHTDAGPTSIAELKTQISSERHISNIQESCNWANMTNDKLAKNMAIRSVSCSEGYTSVQIEVDGSMCTYVTTELNTSKLENLNEFNFVEKRKRRQTSKIFYPKNTSGLNTAGIFISRKNDNNSLVVLTDNYSKDNHAEILNVLGQFEAGYN